MPSASHGISGIGGNVLSGTLAAVIYCTASAVTINGDPVSGSRTVTTSSAGQFIHSVAGATATTFKLDFWTDNGTSTPKVINLTPNTDGYIRDQLNTNPQKVYSNNFATTEKYFLGESYEESVNRHMDGHSKGYGIILPLELASSDATSNLMNRLSEAVAPKTGWIISRDPSPTVNQGSFLAKNMKKLFRVHALHEGEWMHGYFIRICNLRFGTTVNPNCSFSIEVKKGTLTVEKFANLNLDPSSLNYVARRIGTSYQEWDQTYKVFDDNGRYRSRSNFIRVEEAADLKNSAIADTYKIPWGFWGPTRPKAFTLTHGSSGANALTDYDQNTGGTQSSVVITYTGAMSNLEHLTITHPALGAFVITFATGAGAPPTVYTNQAATINIATTDDANKTAVAVQALLNTIPNYHATISSDEVTLKADIAGPFYTIVPTETDASNRQGIASVTAGVDGDNVTNVYVKGGNTMPQSANAVLTDRFVDMPIYLTASFVFPRFKLTEQSTKGGANYKENMDFGVRQAFASDTDYDLDGVQKRKDYLDLARRQAYDLHGDEDTNLEASFVFSLDDIVSDAGEPDSNGISRWYWQEGSHATAFAVSANGFISYTAQSGSSKMTKNGPTSFNIPLIGGSNGLDITQIDPFSNWNVLEGKAANTSYAYHSVNKALDMVRDEEKLRASIISMPGLTNTDLIKEVVNIAEARGDTLAIIDYNDGSKEAYENSGTRTRGSVSTVIDTSENTLQIDSNKAAVYWPKVEITEGGFSFMAPASVAAIGALAYNDANSAGPWFAPAGFNRGGLSILGGQSSGLSVSSTDKNLTKKNRDDLYTEHINPIARFPAVGEVVIFGQKTLYKSEPTSALSRVNVRRLMIFLRQKISDIADTVLFEPNVATTFNNFSNRCQAVLENVKSNFGITEYSIQRIEKGDVSGTGVEEDLRDRNILYVRIFIKPARAIEFIAIDFVISRSDAQI